MIASGAPDYVPFLFLRSSSLPRGTNAPGGWLPGGWLPGTVGPPFPVIRRESRTGGAEMTSC